MAETLYSGQQKHTMSTEQPEVRIESGSGNTRIEVQGTDAHSVVRQMLEAFGDRLSSGKRIYLEVEQDPAEDSIGADPAPSFPSGGSTDTDSDTDAEIDVDPALEELDKTLDQAIERFETLLDPLSVGPGMSDDTTLIESDRLEDLQDAAETLEKIDHVANIDKLLEAQKQLTEDQFDRSARRMRGEEVEPAEPPDDSTDDTEPEPAEGSDDEQEDNEQEDNEQEDNDEQGAVGKDTAMHATLQAVSDADGGVTSSEALEMIDDYGDSTIYATLSTGHDKYLFNRENPEGGTYNYEYTLSEWGQQELNRLGPYISDEQKQEAEEQPA